MRSWMVLPVVLLALPCALAGMSREMVVTSPDVRLVETADGTEVVPSDEGYLPDFGSVGAPALPRKVLLFAVPDRTVCTGLTFTASWESVAESVRVRPVGELVRVGETPPPAVPDASIYGRDAVYPAAPAVLGGEDAMAGVRVVPVAVTPFRWNPSSGRLERVTQLTVALHLAEGAARSYVLSPGMLASVRAAVANPDDVTLEPRPTRPRLAAAPETEETADYLLLSPPDFVDDWTWYVGKRREVHPDVTFKVKNTAEIYAEHPFGGTNACRNAAESIHAYLRAHRATMKFSYVVLGGAWFDAQNRFNRTTYYYGGETMSLSNSVPGIYNYSREADRDIPSDMFYSCLDMKNGQRYPWDANENGKYLDQNDCSNNDIRPDVCVSRITLNPYRPNGWKSYNRHTLVTNYVDKLARGENKNFRGHFRYGLSPDSTGSRRKRENADRMCYDELEFYDNMYNMPDPRHADWIEDNEVEPRRRIKEQFAVWRPVLEAKGMMSFTWTKGFPNLSSAIDDYYAGDRDYGFVYSHGWAQGATHFQAGRFATCKGLTILNGSNGPCDTGYPDYYPGNVLQYNLGDSGVTNPDGGALASINNTRWGWAGGSATGQPFDSSMSYFMLNRSLVGFNQLYMDVGHAWFKGVSDYAAFGYTQGGGTHTWTLTEQICYGDPLVRLPAPEDRWWTGGAVGTWDTTSPNWTNVVDSSLTYYSASNVYFNVTTDTTISVAEPVGALRLSIPVFTQAVVSFVGVSNGSLRVMKQLDIAGGDLYLNVAGGVGHNGITFARQAWNDHAPELTFAGTNEFYLSKVTGAERINLRGGGVTLDVDLFPSTPLGLVFDGPGAANLPFPNVLRSRNANGLARFGSLALTNTYVRLATADGFGRGDAANHTLVNSKLEIAANAFYQWKGCWQQNGYAEKLSATFDVGGDSEVTSSEGGLWSVATNTAFNLQPDATLTLSAEAKDFGGKIIINGADGTVQVKTAASLAGNVEVGPGVTLVLEELPLAGVTSLTLGAGASVVLPASRNGYWQILPVSSRLNCGADVKFYGADARETPLEGQPSLNGSFFREGALYAWTTNDLHWSAFLADTKPKVLFGDLAVNSFTVEVDVAVAPAFASFANAATAYRFRAGDDTASITFSSVIFNGDTAFDLPVAATEYAELLGGTCAFRRIVAPTVYVKAGAALTLTGSHWTRFVLEEGSVLKALPGESLDWNIETTLSFAGTSRVTIDVSALTLTDEPQTLIAGAGHVWTPADLTNFTLTDTFAELRIVDGTLCVVRGDNLKGPYDLTFAGTTNWNSLGWTSRGVPFGKVWADCSLDASADVTLTIPTNVSSTIVLDCPVMANSVTVGTTSNRFTLAAAGGGVFSVGKLDLSGCLGGMRVEVATGTAEVVCPDGDTGWCELMAAGSGTLVPNSGTVVLHHFGEWTLPAGAQGTIRLVTPRGWRPFRVAYAAAGFEMGGLAFEVVDDAGTPQDGYDFALSGGEIRCTPPGVRASVAGTVEWSDLVWTDWFGNDASDVDGRAVKGFQLVGAAGSVVTSTNGFAGVLERLSAKGPVTACGNLTWSPKKPPAMGDLLLGGGFKVKIDLNATPNLLDHARLGLADDGTLEISHGGKTCNASGQDWSGLHGTGRLLHLNSNAGNWLAWPAKGPQGDFAFHNAADVVLTENVSVETPLAVRNLSGAGGFRSDWGGGSLMRPVRTVQTGVSAFAGVFAGKNGNRDSKLIVSSDAPTSTVEKALWLTGNNANWHYLDIETNGCVILTGSWNGTITVKGLLVVTNDAVAKNATIVAPGQRIVVETLPEPMPDPSVVDPPTASDVYPASDTPVVPIEDTRVRVVTVQVGAEGGSWMHLDWRDAKGDPVPVVDWSAVTNATVTAAARPESAPYPAARVIFDVAGFTGVVRLVGGVCVEAHARCPFTLAAESVGAVDFRLLPVPTATCDLLSVTQSSTSTSQPSTSVTVHDRYGNEIGIAGEVTFSAAGCKYYLNVQDVDHPAFSNTFDTQYDDTLSQSLGFSGSGNLTYKAYSNKFEVSRSGRALKGDGLTIHSHNAVPTIDMSGVNAWSINFVLKLPTNDKGIVFGFGNKDGANNGIAFVRVSENVAGVYAWKSGGTPTLIASAHVPFGSTQFHSYAITHDSQTLRFYADGVLAQEASLEGKYPSSGLYQYFKMYGQNGSLQDGNTVVIDDFRFYRYVLTPTSVRTIANAFKPWPETVEAKVWKPETRWSDLVWSVDVDDWSKVSFARLARAADGGSVVCDDAPYANAMELADGVTLLATNELPFALAPNPQGRVAFTLDDVTTSHRLFRVTSAFACTDDEFAVTVRDRTDAEPPEPWMVTRYGDGAYWLRVQDVAKPKYSLTFDGSVTAHLDGTTAPTLKDVDNAAFVAARAGASKALTGRNPYFANALGAYASWTMNVVARMPVAANGIVFAYGANSQGLALYAPAPDAVAIGVWSGSTKREDLIRVAVTNAQVQFHSYALISTGTRLSLYVDGEKRGEAACAGCPGNGNAQFFSVHGGMPSGFAVGTDGAIDDWRFFDECLALRGIQMLADAFAPWPEYRHATLTEETTWSAIDWDGAAGADKPYLLRVAGGALALSEPLTLTNALSVTGGALTIRVSGEGCLRTDAGLSFPSGCQIDVSGLDGTNLAKRAVAGAPYVRWLVRGAYSGKPTVTGLPAMPKHYSVRAEDFSNHGVRLVVTADEKVRLGSVSVSIGNDTFSTLSGDLGLYPEEAKNWLPYATWSVTPAAFGPLAIAALPMTDGKIDPTALYDDSAPRFFRHTSFDGNGDSYDGQECGYVVSNLTAFADAYRVIVYFASDMGDAWGPVTIGGRTYTGLTQGDATPWATLSDSSLVRWGLRSASPAEGVNAVISDVLTNDVVSLVGHRQWQGQRARGQIAAFQVVKVGEIPEIVAVDYAADLTNTTVWADGAGAGLVPGAVDWMNHTASTISITQRTAAANLVFDTPTTGLWLKVTSAAGQSLTLAAETAELAIGSLDLTSADGRVDVVSTFGAKSLAAGADTRLVSARGTMSCTVGADRTLTLNTNLAWGVAGDAVSAGGHVRFLGDRGTLSAPPIQTAGAVVSYERATVTRAAANEFSVLRTRAGDEVVYNANGSTLFNCLQVRGGSLTLRNGTNKNVLYYGSVKDVAARHSSIEVSGGKLTVDVTGTGANNTTCGMLVGVTSTTTYQPSIVVSGGEMNLGAGRLTLWERSDLVVSGGRLTAQGLWKGGGGASTVTLSGDGTLALGAGGIGRFGGGSMSVTLAGGTLLATKSMSVGLPLTVTGTANLVAASGETLTLSAVPTGSGTLICDDGVVVFAAGVSPTLALGGAFTLDLTAAQAEATTEVVLFRTAASFDRTRVTLRGPNGTALPEGELRVVAGQAIWTPAAAAVSVVADDVTVRVPVSWLAARKLDAEALRQNHGLRGLNGVPLWASYVIGLEPTNACDTLACVIETRTDGRFRLVLPAVTNRVPGTTDVRVRYVLQRKDRLDGQWQDHATNDTPLVEFTPGGAPAQFFRYLLHL